MIFIALLEYGYLLHRHKFSIVHNNKVNNLYNNNNDQKSKKKSMKGCCDNLNHHNLDKTCLMLMPIVFTIFNLIFWTTVIGGSRQYEDV